MELNLGQTGAKRQAWHSVSPRDALKLLIETHPNWQRDRMLREFRSLVGKDEKMTAAVIDYFFTNFYNYLTEPPEKPRDHEENVAIAIRAIENAIARQANIKLLELVFPNGKRLSECTGEQCRAYSSKFGGWLLKLSKLLKPKQTVGEKFGEEALRGIYDSVKAI